MQVVVTQAGPADGKTDWPVVPRRWDSIYRFAVNREMDFTSRSDRYWSGPILRSCIRSSSIRRI